MKMNNAAVVATRDQRNRSKRTDHSLLRSPQSLQLTACASGNFSRFRLGNDLAFASQAECLHLFGYTRRDA